MWSGDFEYVITFAKYLDFAILWTLKEISQNLVLLIFSRNLNISLNEVEF